MNLVVESWWMNISQWIHIKYFDVRVCFVFEGLMKVNGSNVCVSMCNWLPMWMACLCIRICVFTFNGAFECVHNECKSMERLKVSHHLHHLTVVIKICYILESMEHITHRLTSWLLHVKADYLIINASQWHTQTYVLSNFTHFVIY